VPVAGFWSNKEGLGRRELLRALESGSADGYRHVIVEQHLADALVAAGITIGDAVRRGDLEDVGVSSARRASASWPPRTWHHPCARSPWMASTSSAMTVSARPMPGRCGSAWRCQRGGLGPVEHLDPRGRRRRLHRRGVYDTVVRRGKGVAFPFDGGTARVTGHGCCDPVYHANEVPRYELTGNKGAVRRLFSGPTWPSPTTRCRSRRDGASTAPVSPSPASRS